MQATASHILTAIYVLFLEATHTDAATDGMAFAKEDKARVCGLAEDLAKYPSLATTHLKNELSYATGVLETELKYQIYTTRHDTAKATAMIPILVALADKKQTHFGNFITKLTKATQAIADTSMLRGRLTETIEMLADLHQHSTAGAGCLSGDSSTTIRGSEAITACGARTLATTTRTTTPLTILLTTGYKGFTATAAGSTKVATGTAKCNLFDTTAAQGVLDDQQVAQKSPFASGYIKLANGAAGYTLEKLDVLGPDGGTAPKAFKAAFLAHKAADEAGVHAGRTHQALTLAELTASAAARAAYKALVKGDQTPYSSAQDDSTIQQEMEQKYGPAPQFSANWWDPVNNDQVAKKSSATEAEGNEPLSNIKDIDKLRKILFYYATEKANRIADKLKSASELKECKKEKKIETDKTCEAKGIADCKEGCKVEGEGDKAKCIKDPNYKPPQAEGANQDGKTNTTGNNSFVSHKYLLFLHFWFYN
ncbi:Trypanosome variant surface glycoprotein (A-type), putative [Trypanosoma equiperdum]|uniref:Trypanosome variant surface glycoprotein (A-type), putative n=1 Tax=Trypanosoma equiperdum TaxID=5694 RepID=A0A1G4I0U4_TRYEQ|nr:Trypanosome variant surface glycoprotein (A-type), putative [Trypanosoma equiperdum]